MDVRGGGEASGGALLYWLEEVASVEVAFSLDGVVEGAMLRLHLH
jgi:hypothetical protein